MAQAIGAPAPALTGELTAAAEQGRICALAAGGQRDLQAVAAAYPELFPARPFDPAVFGTVALATAFGAPWCGREQLRIANLTALWVFAVDWRIDYLAREAADVDGVVERCLATADGAAPGDDDALARMLAAVRDELAAGPAFAEHRPAWREELRRMLTAMRREWRWKTSGERPGLEEYLDNADNFGSSWVNVSHWLSGATAEALNALPRLTTAGRLVQRVLRLANDLATYERDVQWGDLNALLLGVGRDEVTGRMGALARDALTAAEALTGACPREAAYLSRQIGFSTGFYRLTDFWGAR
ncbi:terpene synthase family protein [Dactylosporangium sp. CA-139114]|uniref:terpene synthase family protein n=1 Tax=Dactylosporangium sp. CA-139114 TaxID=3239931 RepID=UPI003D963A63